MKIKKLFQAGKDTFLQGVSRGFSTASDDVVDASVRMANEMSEAGVSLRVLKGSSQSRNVANPNFIGPHTADAIQEATAVNRASQAMSKDFIGPAPKEYEAYRDFANRAAQESNPNFIGPSQFSSSTREALNPNFIGPTRVDESIVNHQQDLFNAETYALENTKRDGIGLWGFMKNHPVISTAAVMGTAWGVSELGEE